ncbi:MAG TPA: diacylglycerol kinase family protein [Sphingomonas sp.]|jgi:hypothetical protein
MRRAWIVTSPGSGSAGGKAGAALDDALADAGVEVGGRTIFPDEALPTAQALDAAGVDTAVLFAGDGTVNACACALGSWGGALLILPGGTMNMLAHELHGHADVTAIIRAAQERGRRVALPFATAEGHCAYVGLIVGPGSSWVRVREAVRAHRWRALGRAVRHAVARTFGRGLRIDGLRGRPQAVYLRAEADRLVVRAIDARSFRRIAELGWDWVTGDWVRAAAVTPLTLPRLRLRSRKPATALFDGEPRLLPVGAVITPGRSRPIFLSMLPEVP